MTMKEALLIQTLFLGIGKTHYIEILQSAYLNILEFYMAQIEPEVHKKFLPVQSLHPVHAAM